jgi:undecaprenyl-diphosphatase
MFAMLWLGAITYILYSYFRNNRRWFAFCVIGAVVVLLVGFSRIFLGVHWMSQVVGGYLIGGMLLAVLIRVHNVLAPGREKN